MSKKNETTVPQEAEQTAPAAAEVVTPAAEETAAPVITRVYCGPSVRNIVRQYTVFSGEIPAALEQFMQQHPAARGLLVPLDHFAETRKNLDRKDTAEAVLYAQVKNTL